MIMMMMTVLVGIAQVQKIKSVFQMGQKPCGSSQFPTFQIDYNFVGCLGRSVQCAMEDKYIWNLHPA